jgi:hypothetical protein
MPIIQIIQLIATLAGAAKDISDVVTDMHAQGLTEPSPEHLKKISAALATVPDDAVWAANHTGN